MKYKSLGNTSLSVSKICLGTMTFGEQNSEKDSFKIMDYANEHGVNFFDTAEMYPTYPRKETQGDSERIIGKWINKKKNRDKVIIATKISSGHPKGIGATGLKWIRGGGKKLKFDKKNINKAVNDSLKRLNTDYIDVYQLHWPERNVPVFGQLEYKYDSKDNNWTPIPEVLENLNDIIRQGKVRYIGLSNETSWGISKFLSCSEKGNLSKPISTQNGYNLINRTYDISNSEISMREKFSLLAHSPLAGGLLSGKYLFGKKPKNSRFTQRRKSFHIHNTNRTEKAIRNYLKIAKKYNISLSNLAYSFVVSRPFVTSCVIGVTSIKQLEKNIKSINLKLSKEILMDIEKIHLSDPNPYIYI
jgi:aryl-alcohol dehydrogenase-like predicted oxidoreductase